MDQNGDRIHITHAILEEHSKITEDQKAKAQLQGIQLVGATLPRGREKLPDLKEIDTYCKDYFRKIGDIGITHVVGHIPHLANAALSMAELIEDKIGRPPFVVLAAHSLPLRDATQEIESEKLCDWLKHSDLLLSIGHDVFEKVTSFIEAQQIAQEERPACQLYLQGAPIDFFQRKPEPNINFRKILTIPGEIQASGYNYKLAVEAAAKALDFEVDEETRELFTTIGANDEEKEIWEQQFNEAYQQVEARFRRLEFDYHKEGKIEELKEHFRNASLYILPLQKESNLYGIDALKAAYAGVPSLMSQSAGVAKYFNILLSEEDPEMRQLGISKVVSKAFETDPVIPNFDEFSDELEAWWPKMREKIQQPEVAQKYAEEIRDKCLLDTKLAATHYEFGQKITGILVFFSVQGKGSCINLIPDSTFELKTFDTALLGP